MKYIYVQIVYSTTCINFTVALYTLCFYASQTKHSVRSVVPLHNILYTAQPEKHYCYRFRPGLLHINI